MLKARSQLIIILILFFYTAELRSQLVANAGNDTIICASNYEGTVIGGFPTASGGNNPYTYSWYGTNFAYNNDYPASTFLSDTAIANPSLIDFWDELRFYLEVRDKDGIIAMDSIFIEFSRYDYCTGECYHQIYNGDSIQLYPNCIMGGIAPFSYIWTPSESLSNSIIDEPWAKPDASTSYYLTIIDSIGCEAHTSCFIEVLPNNFKNYLLQNSNVCLYPNPATTQVHILIEEWEDKSMIFELLNINGAIINTIDIISELTLIDIEDLHPGQYLYRISKGDRVNESGRLIVK